VNALAKPIDPMIQVQCSKNPAAERLWLPTKLQSTQQADVYLATNFLEGDSARGEARQRRPEALLAHWAAGLANRKHDQDARGLPVHYGLSVRLELSSLLEATYRLLLQEWAPQDDLAITCQDKNGGRMRHSPSNAYTDTLEKNFTIDGPAKNRSLDPIINP